MHNQHCPTALAIHWSNVAKFYICQHMSNVVPLHWIYVGQMLDSFTSVNTCPTLSRCIGYTLAKCWTVLHLSTHVQRCPAALDIHWPNVGQFYICQHMSNIVPLHWIYIGQMLDSFTSVNACPTLSHCIGYTLAKCWTVLHLSTACPTLSRCIGYTLAKCWTVLHLSTHVQRCPAASDIRWPCSDFSCQCIQRLTNERQRWTNAEWLSGLLMPEF